MNKHSKRTHYQWIRDDQGQPLALWISADFEPGSTVFLTPDNFLQQLGFIYRESGGIIDPHIHTSLKRQLVGTSEFLLLKKGRVSVDLYDDNMEFTHHLIMEENDMLLLISGAHGFTFLREGYFIEIKQGPYTGLNEKIKLEKPKGTT